METKIGFVITALAIASVLFPINPLQYFFTNLGSGDSPEEEVGGGAGRRRVETIPLGAVGPESFAFDLDDGGPYTGVSDGRILKSQGEGRGWSHFAAVSPPNLVEECRRWSQQGPAMEHVCGRPLGLRFHQKTGELYVADAYRGLLTVDGNSTLKVVASQAQGVPFRFTNALDIDRHTGAVYFTDSSSRFHRREFLHAIISGDKTGRVMRYHPETNEVQVLLHGLSFPNGVALGGGEDNSFSFLLIAETTTCRVLKYWLGTGELEVLADLPGFPDNIKRSPRGGFWVALHTRRSSFLRWLLPLPWPLWEVLRRAPLDLEWWSRPFHLRSTAAELAVRLSEEDGEVLEVIHGVDGDGKSVRFATEVEEHKDGTLWVGNVMAPHVGVCFKP